MIRQQIFTLLIDKISGGLHDVRICVDVDEDFPAESLRAEIVGTLRDAVKEIIRVGNPRFEVLHGRIAPPKQIEEPTFLPEEKS